MLDGLEADGAEGVGRSPDDRRQVGVGGLEARHLVAQLVDHPLRVLIAEASLHLAGQAGQLVMVVSAVLGRGDGVPEVGEHVFEGFLHRQPQYAPRRLAGAVTTHRFAALLLTGALLAAGCSEDGEPGRGGRATEDAGPNVGPLPTIAGGTELAALEPVRVLVGDGLTFGRPLPSEQAGAEAFTQEPEVSSATVRRVHSLPDGRFLGQALVLALNGAEIFDEGVLGAYVRGVVGALGDGTTVDAQLAGRTVVRSRGPAGLTIGFREENLLVVVRGAAEPDVTLVVERQLAAIAGGVVGAPDPATPLVPIPADAAFVAVPTVAFQPFLPSEEEPRPEPPGLPGASGVQGRYGVVAGERRTVVWAFTLDPAAHPSAEALEPAMVALASGRAGGAASESVELIDRVVHRATGGAEVPSATAFRHQGLVLLVEGTDPAQVDAVVSAWITALAAP